MIKEQDVIIYTDYKPVAYTFGRNSKHALLVKLDKIRYISGEEIVVALAPLKISEISLNKITLFKNEIKIKGETNSYNNYSQEKHNQFLKRKRFQKTTRIFIVTFLLKISDLSFERASFP